MGGCGGADGEGSAQPCWKSRSVEGMLVSARSGDCVVDKGNDGAKGETVVEVAVSQEVVEMEKARDVRSCWSGNRRSRSC